MLSNHHTRRQPVITITPSCAHSSHHVCLIRASLRHSSSSLIWMTCRGRLAGCSSRGGDGASRDGASRDGASGDCASGDCASATRRGARLAARAAGFDLEGSPSFSRLS